jgi:hypothetical protein
MAGRRGGAWSLVVGLLTVAAGLAALSSMPVAEPRSGSDARAAQGAPPDFLSPKQKRSKTRKARQLDSDCGFPWTYSRPLRRCICAREGFSLQSGKCVLDAASASCGDNERWSPKVGACVCAKDYKREGDRCVANEPVTATGTPSPESTPSVAPEEQKDERAEGTLRSQRCFAELGYYEGAIDGTANADTWTAYWHFKNEHGMKGYADFLGKTVQEKLASLCKSWGETAAIELGEQPGAQSGTETTGAIALDHGEPAPINSGPSLDIDCLPEDLLGVLRRAHGAGVSARQCMRTCLPTPSGLDQIHLDELQNNNDIVWCRTCIVVDGRLTLEDVQRIERAGNIELCTAPSRQLPGQGSAAVAGIKAYTTTRALYRALPPAAEDRSAIAVIIGNRNYAKLPPRPTSRNDADAMYAFLTEHLGYRQDNIIDVRDAKKDDFERVFGAWPGAEGDLARMVRSEPNAKVLVYYSGHGTTDAAQKEAYLLPIDTELYREELSGYPLSTLYANLAKLDADSVLVLLETEHGRDHSAFVLPPNLPETVNTALPVAPLPSVTVLAASDRGQRTLVDPTYDIGLFTRYLIQGLAGSADLRPIGDGDGKLDSAEIYVYTAAMVQLAARKSFGLLQNPVYSSAATPVLTSAGTVAAEPN